MFRSLMAAVVASCLLVPVSGSLAQGQRPSMQPEPEPVEEGPNVAKWRDAYAHAGRPRVMLLVAQASTSVDPLDMESLLKLQDEGGVSAKISSSILEVLGDPLADAEIIDRAALINAIKRASANRAQAGDADSIQIIGRELAADLAIVVKLLPSQRPGSDFSVTFDTRDLSRGRRGMSFIFDWKGGSDAVNIKNNSRAMARKFINDFAERATMPRRFTLRILGLTETSEQTQAYKAIRESREFVKSLISRGSDTVPDLRNPRQSVAASQYEVTLADAADADAIIVQDGIETALKRVFPDRTLQTLQTERGSIMVQLFPRKVGDAVATAEDCSLILLDDEAGKTARAELKSLYDARNAPRVAILCNRPLTPRERKALESKGGVGNIDNLIVIGGHDATGIDQAGGKVVIGADEDFLSPSELEQNAREMERALSEIFNQNLGFTRLISPDVARASAVAELSGKLATQGGAIDQNELLALLKKLDLADVVILGTGRISGIEQRYSFEAVNLRDAIKIGFGDTRYNPFARDRDPAAVLAELRAKAAADLAGASRRVSLIANDEITKMAREATSKLACTMITNWRAPAEMDIVVSGLENQSQLDQLVEQIRKGGGMLEVVGSTTYQDSTGRFRLRYRSHADAVPAELQRVSASLPFALTVAGKSDTATELRVGKR